VTSEVKQGLPEWVLDLWCEGRTLTSYSWVEALDVASRNVVYRVADGAHS
jgi:hypothetical protein